MSTLTIDAERCSRDGRCVDVCPKKIPTQTSPGAPIVIDEALRKWCIECGHCVAVCPKGAIALESMRPDALTPIARELALDPARAEQFLRARRSIRAFKDGELPQETIRRIIEIARYAPSGHNAQPVEWLILSGREQLKALSLHVIEWMRSVRDLDPATAKRLGLRAVIESWEAGCDRVLHSAPHLVVAHAPQGNPMAPGACTIALTYAELAATSFGAGACWAGYFHMASLHYTPLKKALALPEGHQAHGALMLGYPKHAFLRIPGRKAPSITFR